MQLVQNPENFLNDFIAEIRKANKSILIQSMCIEPGRVMDPLEKELLNAVKRGVEVRINYDWVTHKFVNGDLALLPVLNSKKRIYSRSIHKQIREMLKRLADGGVKIVETNPPSFILSFLPFLNRNHIKMYVIDGRIAWIGGLNLFDVAFENIDLMVKIYNEKIIAALLNQFEKVNKNRNRDNYNVDFGDNYSLYADIGKHGKSIIYDKAITMIKEAQKNILFMSQFVPDGPLLGELIKASKRNVAITVITSSDKDALFEHYPSKLTYLYFKSIIKKYPNIKLINLKKHMHIKLLMVDNKLAITGSHNMTFSGVLFGTEEIMLGISDRELIKQLIRFINELMTGLYQ
jgi:phosphatidylserine/phosphatidylglycerophosphate/cardiolipin synthase-like enzyme